MQKDPEARAAVVKLAKAMLAAGVIDEKTKDRIEEDLEWRKPIRDMRHGYELGN